MGFFDLFKTKNKKAEDYDWAIGKKRLLMTTGVYFAPKDVYDAAKKDPVIEGKKRGYQQAAEEFEKIYRELKTEYDNAKELFKKQLAQKDKQLDEYIAVLEKLEKEKGILENELKAQEKRLEVKISASAGFIYFDFSSILKNHPKFDKAKIDGYNEAKAIYKRKLSYLKGQLTKLKNEANKTINEHQELIAMALSEISQLKMVIAEMKLVK